MDWEQQCVKLCGRILVLALILRLASMGVFTPVGQALASREAISLLLYLQTGRVLRFQEDLPKPPEEQKIPEETKTAGNDRKQAEFSGEEADLIRITDRPGYEPDIERLLLEPLDWNLEGMAPKVLILHTHATECYTHGEGERYELSGEYRTLEEEYNMLCLGALVARRLEEAGIPVIHDRDLHDYPDYNSAYAHAASSTEEILEEYPSIELILDLHRDAADTAYGQMVTACSIGSETAAQLMFVVGTDAGGLNHPDWKENLSVALKLYVLLERENPGICRPLLLTAQRYNQHLGNRALLVEIGAAGNTLREAELAAEALARAVAELQYGTVLPG